MKLIKSLFLGIFILTAGVVFGQQPPDKKKTEVKETQAKNPPETETQKKSDIKTVPKARLPQSQLKKINQAKAKQQSQKLKTAMRKSKIMRKPIKK